MKPVIINCMILHLHGGRQNQVLAKPWVHIEKGARNENKETQEAHQKPPKQGAAWHNGSHSCFAPRGPGFDSQHSQEILS